MHQIWFGIWIPRFSELLIEYVTIIMCDVNSHNKNYLEDLVHLYHNYMPYELSKKCQLNYFIFTFSYLWARISYDSFFTSLVQLMKYFVEYCLLWYTEKEPLLENELITWEFLLYFLFPFPLLRRRLLRWLLGKLLLT